MNKVILRGLLTKDVELKQTSNNKVYARFIIAVKRDYKNSDGKYERDFISCVAYGNLAETICKYFHKDSGIIVEGRVQTGSYEDKNGNKVFTTDIMVERIEFDRKVTEKKEESKTNEEIIASVVNDDPYEKMGEQVRMDISKNDDSSEFELPF